MDFWNEEAFDYPDEKEWEEAERLLAKMQEDGRIFPKDAMYMLDVRRFAEVKDAVNALIAQAKKDDRDAEVFITWDPLLGTDLTVSVITEFLDLSSLVNTAKIFEIESCADIAGSGDGRFEFSICFRNVRIRIA